MALLNKAEEQVKSAIFSHQVECTRMVGRILDTQGETLCGNDLEKLAQYLELLAAIKLGIEEVENQNS